MSSIDNENFKRGLSIGLSLGGAQVIGGNLIPDWLSAAEGKDNVLYYALTHSGYCNIYEPIYLKDMREFLNTNKIYTVGMVSVDVAGNISTSELQYTDSSKIMDLYSSLNYITGLGVSYNRNRYYNMYLLNIDDKDKITNNFNIGAYICCKTVGDISNVKEDVNIYVNKNKQPNTTNHRQLTDNSFRFEYVWTPGNEPNKFNCVAYSSVDAANTEIFYPLGNAKGADGTTYTNQNIMRNSNKLLRYVAQSSTVYDVYSYDVFTGIEVLEGTFYAPSASYLGRYIVSGGKLYCIYSNKLYSSSSSESSGWRQLATISTTSGRTTLGSMDIKDNIIYFAYSGVSSSKASTAPTIYTFDTVSETLVKNDVPTNYNNYFRSNKIEMIDSDNFRVGFKNSTNNYIGCAIYNITSKTFSYDFDMMYLADFYYGNTYVSIYYTSDGFYTNRTDSNIYKVNTLGATCLSFTSADIDAQSTGVGLNVAVDITY